MSKQSFRVALLDATHNRDGFNSGSAPLDRYFQQQVTQDVRRRVGFCFVALTDEQRIAGYYTLAAASVLLTDLPPEIGKKLPRYPSVPAVRMGRLAVDMDFKGLGLGGALLADALARAVNSEIAAYAMVVDAKDKKAADFYRHHGFIPLPNSPLTLFLPLATAATAVNK
jgi:ribosomal protein S18 acetylase RimI-like enzyme